MPLVGAAYNTALDERRNDGLVVRRRRRIQQPP
jgi:hypothetical protein